MPLTTLPPATIVRQLRDVLHEAFEGSPHSGTYFSDKGASLFGTIDGLTAEQASRPSGPSGTTIAGHVHHMAFSADASTAWIRGDRAPRDWEQSWTVRNVTDAEWSDLRERLRQAYDELQAALEDAALASEEAFGGALGVVAHAAYHLACIRQKAGGSR